MCEWHDCHVQLSFPIDFVVPEYLDKHFIRFDDSKIKYSVDISDILSHIISDIESIKKFIGYGDMR